MTWGDTSASKAARRNRRIRGHGTWGEQNRRLDKERRRRERGQRSGVLGKAGSAVSAGALILGVVLLLAPGTRGAGVLMLVLVGLGLYVVSGHKRA